MEPKEDGSSCSSGDQRPQVQVWRSQSQQDNECRRITDVSKAAGTIFYIIRTLNGTYINGEMIETNKPALRQRSTFVMGAGTLYIEFEYAAQTDRQTHTQFTRAHTQQQNALLTLSPTFTLVRFDAVERFTATSIFIRHDRHRRALGEAGPDVHQGSTFPTKAIRSETHRWDPPRAARSAGLRSPVVDGANGASLRRSA